MSQAQRTSAKVRVFTRLRPLFSSERQEGHLCGWTVSPEQTQIYPITNPGAQCDLEEQLLPHAIDKNGHLVYQFDRCFDDTASTKEIFEWIAKPLIEPLLNGVNGSILTYGQTGSGKTHSIFGTFKDAGLIELAAREIFSRIKNCRRGQLHRHGPCAGSRTQTPNAGREIHDRPGTIFTVKVSYIEIYMERVNDLLQDGQRGNKYQAENLPVKEDPFKGFYVQGMHEQEVETVSDVLHTLQQADRKRRFARTDFNAMSSRSHVIFSIIVESFTPVDTSLKNARGTEAVGIWRTARLSLVDLAGSERLAIRRRPYTSARLSSQPDLQARRRSEEGKMINKSLFFLSQCIGMLTRRTSSATPGRVVSSMVRQIPYRHSKLTRILASTLGGNANVALLVTLHPSHKYADVTHNSLKFAQRVGCLRVHAQTNCHTTKEHSVILRQKKIIEQLRAELQNSQKQLPQPSQGIAEQSEEMNRLKAELQDKLTVLIDLISRARSSIDNCRDPELGSLLVPISRTVADDENTPSGLKASRVSDPMRGEKSSRGGPGRFASLPATNTEGNGSYVCESLERSDVLKSGVACGASQWNHAVVQDGCEEKAESSRRPPCRAARGVKSQDTSLARGGARRLANGSEGERTDSGMRQTQSQADCRALACRPSERESHVQSIDSRDEKGDIYEVSLEDCRSSRSDVSPRCTPGQHNAYTDIRCERPSLHQGLAPHHSPLNVATDETTPSVAEEDLPPLSERAVLAGEGLFPAPQATLDAARTPRPAEAKAKVHACWLERNLACDVSLDERSPPTDLPIRSYSKLRPCMSNRPSQGPISETSNRGCSLAANGDACRRHCVSQHCSHPSYGSLGSLRTLEVTWDARKHSEKDWGAVDESQNDMIAHMHTRQGAVDCPLLPPSISSSVIRVASDESNSHSDPPAGVFPLPPEPQIISQSASASSDVSASATQAFLGSPRFPAGSKMFVMQHHPPIPQAVFVSQPVHAKEAPLTTHAAVCVPVSNFVRAPPGAIVLSSPPAVALSSEPSPEPGSAEAIHAEHSPAFVSACHRSKVSVPPASGFVAPPLHSGGVPPSLRLLTDSTCGGSWLPTPPAPLAHTGASQFAVQSAGLFQTLQPPGVIPCPQNPGLFQGSMGVSLRSAPVPAMWPASDSYLHYMDPTQMFSSVHPRVLRRHSSAVIAPAGNLPALPENATNALQACTPIRRLRSATTPGT